MASTTPQDDLEEAVVCNFIDNHGYRPYGWQIDSTKHIVAIATQPPQSSPTPVLLCHTTGGGKSSVRDAAALTIGGVCLTIVPLLSLAADQTTKILHLKKTNNRISVYNLDDL